MQELLIIQNIQKHISLTLDEKVVFVSLLKEKKLHRKQLILHEGQVCHHTAFVVKGCLRSYTIDTNGFEHVLSFAPSGWWIADMYSLITQKPGYLNIDALEDTEIYLLPKDLQDDLYETIPKFERFFRILAENSLVTFQQRLLDNLSITALERYKKFCITYPTLINHLPQKQIAAYIGVTPEFLSSIKTQMLTST